MASKGLIEGISDNRQEFTVFQANKVSRALGSLDDKEQQFFDYLSSFIRADDTVDSRYETTGREVLDCLYSGVGGKQYQLIQKLLNNFQSRTIVIPDRDKDGNLVEKRRNIVKTDYTPATDKLVFMFDPDMTELLFNLRERGFFFSLPLSVSLAYKTKYGLLLHKMWEAGPYDQKSNGTVLAGNKSIVGTLDEFKEWFLGIEVAEEDKKVQEANNKLPAKERRRVGWYTSRFRNKVINVAIDEFNKVNVNRATATLEVLKQGRTVIGYRIRIVEDLVVLTASDEQKHDSITDKIEGRAKLMDIPATVAALELYAEGKIDYIPEFFKID